MPWFWNTVQFAHGSELIICIVQNQHRLRFDPDTSKNVLFIQTCFEWCMVFIACEDVTYVCNMVAQVTVNRFRSSVSSDKQTVVHHTPLTHVINYSILSRDGVCLFELHTDSMVIFVLFASSCSSIWCPNTSSLIINSMCCVYPSVPFSVDPARRGESSSTVLKNNYTVWLLW